ncbi:hypothetical protein DYBT9275_02486 [Dyadobacter sp. CECT 9275]|uniref:Uncharacterized protein n=1 Tax=Dyadobacter helix TaxID=2822344 RepID=A0A916JCA1_9BACT|nr:hypothetical protein [Dyadobacter sp. CECT 9275]CAG5000551.1 hypothetical protein DYBT9275_02486 [Dyadobacter sp. CECT 9275]
MKKLSKTLLASAITAALFSSSPLFAQVKIGSNPTTIEAGSNLEVEASTPSRQVKVDKTSGQLTIKDGTEGLNKILVSDANGGASWKKIRLTDVTTFTQTSGIQLVIPLGNTLCQNGNVNPPACAKDMNLDGSFTITEVTSDVIIESLSIYTSEGNVAGSKNQFTIMLYVDKTTPGVFESVAFSLQTSNIVGCDAQSANVKAVLKDLPPRAAPYQIKAFAGAWSNNGTFAVVVGMGMAAVPGCGTTPSVGNNRLIVSVTQ